MNQTSERCVVDVLLATYNGGRYLGPQIDSLLGQSHADWRLVIRDDGSTDNTLAICEAYAAKHPGKIRVVSDGLGRLGVGGNFSELLRQSSAEHVMFCDQDDVWLPRKIQITLAAMKDLELANGAQTPALAHTDSKVVGEDLQLIAPSLLKYLRREPNAPLGRMCMELPIYGHTAMINRALLDMAGPIPDGFVSWDWWHPLVATVLGRIVYVDEPATLFRRHGDAASSGSTRMDGLSAYLAHSMADYRRKVHISLRQCEIFYERLGARLNAEQRTFFESVGQIRQANWIRRRYLILRHRLFKTGLPKTFGVLLAV